MLMEQAAPHRRLRAPQEDGQTLVDPSCPVLPELVSHNRQQAAAARCDLQGRSLAEFSAGARRSLVEAALAYTSRYADLESHIAERALASTTPVLLSGHQPQLFHPGVWYKNFFLGRLADEVDGVGIHLLIDSDLCRSAAVRVPTGSVEHPRVELVAYDRPAEEVPYEECCVVDEALFASFADRATAAIGPLVAEPLVQTFWPLVRQRHQENENLGRSLAAGRHVLERSWGNTTLEIPQSAVCQLPEFHWFAAHLLAHLPRFWSAFNDALAAYRQAHRLRNRAQPVPDLAESDGWLETPFWMWTAQQPQRRPLFAHQQGDQLRISDRRDQTFSLAVSPDRDLVAAVEQLRDLAARGVRIRTRALATTLFARLCLSDLFVHGIGGAKYDQVTDVIAQRFLGIELPRIAAVSATLRLPIDRPPQQEQPERALRQELRELDFHPEVFVERNDNRSEDETSQVLQIIAEKRRWIETPKTVQNSRQRHLAIASSIEALQPHVAQIRAEIEQRLADVEARRRADAILNSREFSFCLYPREQLQRLLLDDVTRKP